MTVCFLTLAKPRFYYLWEFLLYFTLAPFLGLGPNSLLLASS